MLSNGRQSKLDGSNQNKNKKEKMKKKISYIAFALAGLLFASCMGDDYAGANYDEIPYGNNALTEDNVVTIAALKDKYSTPINTTYGYEQVTSDLKIKGVVTSSDEQGNIYNELAIQDSTGAVILSVAQGGLYSFLPVGTEVLIDLKDLYVGNYGMQPEIGVPTTNASGVTSIGRMSRATFDKHFKILSSGNVVEPEEFDASSWSLDKDAGKLAVVRNVTFWHSRVDSTYANADGGAGSVSWYFKELGTSVQVYNSNYADFANAVVPNYPVDVTGIMKRYRDSWELIIRTLDDVKPAATAIYEEGFTEKTGGWEAYDISKEGLDYVWGGSNYGAKASAYKDNANHAAESWLISPEIDLSSAKKANLTITQAANFIGSTFGENCHILISTNYAGGAPSKAKWTELSLDNVPTADTKWSMVNGATSLNAYAGKKIRLAFRYVSTTSTAPTWEIREVTIK